MDDEECDFYRPGNAGTGRFRFDELVFISIVSLSFRSREKSLLFWWDSKRAGSLPAIKMTARWNFGAG